MSKRPERGVSANELLEAGLIEAVRGPSDLSFQGVRHDSRQVEPGDLFVAVPGFRVDGARFAQEASARGAEAIATEAWLDGGFPQLRVKTARRALGFLAERVYRSPSNAIALTGVTGTNGKSTTVAMLGALLSNLDERPATIGTLGLTADWLSPTAQTKLPALTHTTPEGDDISRALRALVDEGGTHAVMEVSSHALTLGRVDALRFVVSAFTNLSQDHLDFHKSMDAYFNAKARLFRDCRTEHAVINVDDSFGSTLADEIDAAGRSLVRCTIEDAPQAALALSIRGESIHGVEVRLGTSDALLPMVGAHNAANLAVALGCLVALGKDPEKALRAGLARFAVPGRLESVHVPGAGIDAWVDYAHTPAALESAICAVRARANIESEKHPRREDDATERVIVVFGAGGDRDSGKRPQMGEVAARLADIVVLTNDNPRGEDPQNILQAIASGLQAGAFREAAASELKEGRGLYGVEPDRHKAIALACGVAAPGDRILVAGKGHETYQIIGKDRLPFDDREVLREALGARARSLGEAAQQPAVSLLGKEWA